jgi:hypothetical protein
MGQCVTHYHELLVRFDSTPYHVDWGGLRWDLGRYQRRRAS